MPPSRSRLQEELELLEARMHELRAQIAAESGEEDPLPRHLSDRDGAAQALDGNNIGYWEWEIAESRTYVSRSWARLLGYEVEELEPGLRAWERLVHPEDFPQALWKLEAHLRGELESYEAEFRMRARSGEYRWILSRGRVIERAPDGLPLRMTGVHIDVHKRHDDEELMQQLAKHLGDGIFLASVRPRSLLYANPAFEQLLGGSAERWIGKPLRNLLALVHPEDRRRVRHSFRKALDDGRFAEQFRILRPAGEIAHVHVRSFPIFDAEGRLNRLSGSIQDTTELVTARRDKASLEQQLVHAQRIESIGRLAGGVAHDFNNVLTAVLGNVALLKNSIRRGHGEPGFVEAGLDHIEHAAREAAELTRQLLIFGRRQELRPELLTPELVVRDCQRMLERLIRENIQLQVHCDENCWFLEADASSLKQVVLNLAVNASDAMPAGGELLIETRNVYLDEVHDPDDGTRIYGATPEPGPYVRFSIRDSGSGIPEELLDEIFDPFFTTKEAHVGTGLGLSIVHGIVLQSGGHVIVDTEPDVGTCFHVLLPAMTPEEVEERVQGNGGRVGTASDPLLHAPRGQQETILVCEDQVAVLELTARILQQAGYRVIRARDADQALQAYEHYEGIALLLTDVVLPGVSGANLALSLRTHNPKLPVLFMSGYPSEDIQRSGFDEEASPVLRKPFEPARLLELVAQVLRNGKITPSRREGEGDGDGQSFSAAR